MQVDAGMNQVMSVLTSVIGRNLQVLAEQMRLGSAEVKGLQSGNPLTLIVENDLGTEGIDLNARTGRMCRGDKLKESPQFIKTTLLDVKKATAMITQRVDRIAHELDQQREEQNEEVGKKDDRTLQQEEQRVAQMERDDKNVPKEIVVIVDRRNFY